jgi:tetratricopeptide (TPR) repeat protein
MRKSSEQDNLQENIKNQLILLYASQLATCGQLDEAEKLIKEDKMLSSSPMSLDLLARIAVQKGHFNQAKKLWQMALALDPDNKTIQIALACISGPWLFQSMLKRISFLTIVALIITFVISEVMAIFPVIQPVRSFCDSAGASMILRLNLALGKTPDNTTVAAQKNNADPWK